MVSASQVPLCFAGNDAHDIRTGYPSSRYDRFAHHISSLLQLVNFLFLRVLIQNSYAQNHRDLPSWEAAVAQRGIATMRGSTESGFVLARRTSEVMPTTSSRRR